MPSHEAADSPEALQTKLVQLHELFDRHGMDHAFSGALALSHYLPTPRNTADIDIAVFLPNEKGPEVLDALDELFPISERYKHLDHVATHYQASVDWGLTPIDVFFSFSDEFHAQVQQRVRKVHLFDLTTPIPIVSPEDLIIFKSIHGRQKDALDVIGILDHMGDEIDREYIFRWLSALTSPDSKWVGWARDVVEDRRVVELEREHS